MLKRSLKLKIEKKRKNVRKSENVIGKPKLNKILITIQLRRKRCEKEIKNLGTDIKRKESVKETKNVKKTSRIF